MTPVPLAATPEMLEQQVTRLLNQWRLIHGPDDAVWITGRG